ncbi:MAG: Glutamate--tRNA ligase [Legionellaceae bacterium]
MGNVRTALFNALIANKLNGEFLLRIEDTDKTRSTEEYTDILQTDLVWLLLNWSEGPQVGGDAGPYWQSQRQAIYDEFYKKLEETGYAYPCFCTDPQLAMARKVQLASGKPPRYSGVCLHLTQEQIREKIAQGQKPTLRFKVPDKEKIQFTDLVRGEQIFNSQDIGDFIIRRADGTASFMFCNAIDDSLMGVSHALRGEDHLTNTPRQVLILQALNMHIPLYGHIPMIVGSDGSPLSKRHGSKSIKELREDGYFPLALINYMARLGHYYKKTEFMSLTDLAMNFSIEAIGTAPARYDLNQLLHWQKEAVQHASDEEIWHWMGHALHSHVIEDKKELFIKTIRTNILFPKDALKWANTLFSQELDYSQENQEIIQKAGNSFFTLAAKAIHDGFDYKQLCHLLESNLNVKGKSLFLPLRVALTNEMTGPEMAPLLILMGKENAIQRFEKARLIAS